MEYPTIWTHEAELFHDICTDKRGINLQTLESVLLLAVEIAREGREGRKIGTMFVISDAEETLCSRAKSVTSPQRR